MAEIGGVEAVPSPRVMRESSFVGGRGSDAVAGCYGVELSCDDDKRLQHHGHRGWAEQ